MNSIPRANKFRIRRASPLTVAASAQPLVVRSVPTAQQPVALPLQQKPVAQGADLPPFPQPSMPQPFVPQPTTRRPAPAVSAAPGKAQPGSLQPGGDATVADMPFAPAADDGFGDGPYPTAAPRGAQPAASPPVANTATPPVANTATPPGARSASLMGPDVMSAQEMSEEEEADAIRRESLTGRQLRMARRMAQKHGLPATSDFDAVRLLRRAGIDPFQRSNMLELVLPSSEPQGTVMQVSEPVRNTLPQTVRQAPPPSKDVKRPEPPRVQDIMAIQADLVRRRRRKSLLLLARLAFFVGLPTLLCAIYFYTIATPLYATKSDFVIQKADAPGGGALPGLLTGTAFATATDSITVQAYLQSRDAMLRLDQDLGFKAHFSQPDVDPLQRLAPDATNEAAYRLYKRNVKIGFDPTEGIIRMEVIALDPKVSEDFSHALIKYAEQQVDQLTQRVRGDQMQGARESYAEAEQNMLTSQRKVVDLQQKFKVLSSEVEVSMLATQISALESQLTQERLRLEELLANKNPSAARVDPVRNRIANLEAEVAAARSKMTDGDASGTSLAEIQSQLLAAQADVQTRQLMLSTALEAMETARVEANRQVRYLSVGVNPVAPDEPTYPRAFEDSFMAFMIFAGIYLMLSMTASILREQVAA